jgi:MOSC domain-containing protein
MATVVGKLGGIMRFPIKSLLGETLDECMVSERGLDGDRALALVDTATGKIASAKQPNLWRDMLKLVARTDPASSQPRIIVSDAEGGQRDHLAADFDAWVSGVLGRSVKLTETKPIGIELNRARPDEVLARGMHEPVTQDVLAIGAAAPGGGFFDFAPVHLVTTASLAALSSAAPDATISVKRYRPNLVIETVASTAFVETQWIGRRIRIGQFVELEIIAPTPRCAVPMLSHGVLPASPSAVRTVNELNRVEFPLLGPGRFPCLGVYATVLSSGHLQRGDIITLN